MVEIEIEDEGLARGGETRRLYDEVVDGKLREFHIWLSVHLIEDLSIEQDEAEKCCPKSVCICGMAEYGGCRETSALYI